MTVAEYKTDAELVLRTLEGDRDAFNHIVSRYQILICSLAYSRIGHLGQSEDVAQETFITAWKHLRLLRQPEKLRAWLCGIVRNRAKKCLQHETRQPVYDAEPLETLEHVSTPEALPSDETISQEEEAILWRALQRLPELYREPLILFYREHQSIEHVAVELELSEDAVKQRLSRGRKLLQEEVEAFVENALRKTVPTPAFSSAVLAALPLAGGPAATAGFGVAGKGAVAKGLFLVCLAPFIGIFTGFGAQWLMIHGGNAAYRRTEKIRLIITWTIVVGYACGGQYAMMFLGHHFGWSDPVFFAAVTGFWWIYAMTIAAWIVHVYTLVQAKCQSYDAAGKMVQPEIKPIKPGVYAGIVAGTHIMMFWAFIFLAWNEHDRLMAVIITGLMTALGIWNYFNIRGRTGPAMWRAYIIQVASCCAGMLAVFNLRFDVWIASMYGISVAELHHRVPVWMVPLLTLVLALWTVILLAIAKPKTTASKSLD